MSNIDEDIEIVEEMIKENKEMEKDINFVEIFEGEKILRRNEAILNLANNYKRLKKDMESWKKYAIELEEEIAEKNNKIFDLEFKVENCNKIIDQLNETLDEED